MKIKTSVIVVVSSITLGLVFGFQNCAQQVGFDTSSSEQIRQLGELAATSAVQIENGAPYTRQPRVQLKLVAARATEMKISNDAQCTDGAWEAFTGTREWTLARTNDTVAVYAQFKDVRGNVTACVSDDIIQDDQPPTLAFQNAADFYTKSAALTVRWTARDNFSSELTFNCKDVAGGPVGCTGQSLAANATREGGNSVSVQAVDQAGNTSAFIPYAWTFDQTPPVVKINSNLNGTVTGDQVSINFSATDNSGAPVVRCSLDAAAFAPCASPVQLTLPEGSHTFRVTAADRAGNEPASPASVSFGVDTSVPDVKIVNKPAAPSNVAAPSFTFSGNDDGQPITTGFKCTLDGVTTNCAGTTQAYAGLKDQEHTFKVSYVDAGGHVGQDSYTWVVDTLKPAVTVKSPFTPINNLTSGAITWTIVEANGVASYACELDGQALACGASGATITDLKEGPHAFKITVKDSAGNLGVATAAPWTTDLVAPDVKITSGPTGFVKEASNSFTFVSGDPRATFKCKLDAGAYAACATPYVLVDQVANISHDLFVKAVDPAGNESPAETRHWEVDRKGPLILVENAPTVVHRNDVASFVYQVRDEGVGVAGVKCGPGSALQDCDKTTGRVMVDTSQTGAFRYVVQAVDTFGNTSERVLNVTVTTQVIVCDIFSTDSSKCNGGLVGSIYYLDQAHRDLFTAEKFPRAVDYFFGADQNTQPNAVQVQAVLNLKQLNVPTRDWTEGFPTSTGAAGGLVKNDRGEDLKEYFAFNLRTNLQLDQAIDEEGWYQFATISDDGSIMSFVDTDNGKTAYETLVNNDGDHSTRMKCGTKALYLSDKSSLPTRVKYYQGPKTEIALMLVWRKVAGPSAEPSYLCGFTNADFSKFKLDQTDWKVVKPTNLLAPAN